MLNCVNINIITCELCDEYLIYPPRPITTTELASSHGWVEFVVKHPLPLQSTSLTRDTIKHLCANCIRKIKNF